MPTPNSETPEFILTVSCPDRAGLIYAVTKFLAEADGFIVQSQQFGDRGNHAFFMRVQFYLLGPGTLRELQESFEPVATLLQMRWQIFPARQPTRALLMVSKEGHCLNDLLFRQRSGALNIDIPAIVSNHTDLADIADAFGVRFHHLPVTAETKKAGEAALLDLIRDLEVDVVILARYMQVLTPATCTRLQGRAINIHHSFLPGFKGSKPYHQAHERGVKLIGATAHFITEDLDEGPIIEQDVTRVDHTFDAADLVAAGRDVEAQVLARAVRWYAEHRVLINGRRVVVFR